MGRLNLITMLVATLNPVVKRGQEERDRPEAELDNPRREKCVVRWMPKRGKQCGGRRLRNPKWQIAFFIVWILCCGLGKNDVPESENAAAAAFEAASLSRNVERRPDFG